MLRTQWGMLAFVSLVVLAVLPYHSVNGGYAITTPRRWTVGASSQVCVTLTDPSVDGDSIQASIINDPTSLELLSPEKTFALTAGEQDGCFELLLETSKGSKEAYFKVQGTLLGEKISHSKKIVLHINPVEVFVQTDKYLYKPGQLVQFRILTVKGPFLEVLTSKYSEVVIENPSGSRVAQWLDVENTEGLLHMSFQLSEEPEEGEYKVVVKLPTGTSKTRTFKVEDYVLPRYEVTVTPPPYVLGTSESALFKVCAKYTFGQPVKGSLVLELDNGGWGEYSVNIDKKANISGCVEVDVLTEDLKISSKNFHAFKITAKANVIEDGTGVLLASDKKTVEISRTAINFENLSLQKFNKPNLPFVGEVKATFPDGTVAVNEPVDVCGHTCKLFNTNANGIVKFALPANDTGTIRINAINYSGKRDSGSWRSIMYASSTSITMKKYHSGSNSSLVIALSDTNLECITGTTIDFELPVRFSTRDQGLTRVVVQVISRGEIQFTSTTEHDLSIANDLHIPDDLFISPNIQSDSKATRGLFTVPISLPVTVSPSAEILVWFVRKDGEVVSDHRDVDITECLRNSVTINWDQKKGQPGDDTQLNVEAEPLSLCSIGVVDKSVEILSAEHKTLTLQRLLEVAQKSNVQPYDVLQVDDFTYCRDKLKESDGIDTMEEALPVPDPPVLPPVALPAEEVIRKKRSIWNPYYTDDIDALHMFDNAGLYIISNLTLETRPCQNYGIAFRRTIFYDSPVPSPVNLDEEHPPEKDSSPRTYFPETWLWELLVVETGSTQIPLTLPDTVTEWVGQAVCVHPSKGVGLSNSASIVTFRDFFVDLTLPPTTKRGETLPVKISVFNYLTEQLPVFVELKPSPEYDILEDTGDALGTGVRTACLEPQDKTVLTVRIHPKEIGDVQITINAMVDLNSIQCGTGSSQARSDILIKPIKVELEGFPKEKVWSKFICSTDIEEGTDTIEPWVMEAPNSIVEDSARGWVSVVGDLMGPTIENLGGLVKMPYGCGEQNMLNFAPNIYVLQYLGASNQTTKELAEKSIGFMEKGYQRELTYRHSDGSYSAFGSRDDSGSTWLTAFVVRSFFQAKEFIQIDPTDLVISQDWLRRKQLENGCFESVGRILHKGMKGGLSNSDSPSLLSAFVLISLMESGEDPASPAVREALFCLGADKSVDPYTLAVKGYALALAQAPSAQETIEGLLSVAEKTSSSISWKMPSSTKGSKGLGVETAGYAVLALLASDAQKYKQEARLIIKWINNARNGQGGFVSTQDTIVALHALASYERMIQQSTVLDASVLFDDATGQFSTVFEVNENNKLLLQKERIPFFPATIQGDIVGSGCLLMQGVLRYNIPEAESSSAFNISVKTSTPSDVKCQTKEISVCASYLLEDKASNMAIIEVNLVSGYIPLKEDLKSIVGYGTGFFKRYEVDGSTVNFYVDEFTSKDLCLKFRILREVDVEKPKPGTVKVYDYYKPEYAITETYTLPDPTECVTTQPELPFEDEIIPLDAEEPRLNFSFP